MRRFLIGALCSAILALSAAFLHDKEIEAADISSSASAAAQTSKPSLQSRKRVDDLYNQNCARCHGPDGRGDTTMGQVFNSPNLTDPNWWKENASITSAKSFRSIIARGKGGMPAFGKKLTKAEISLLADRMRRFRN